MIATDFDYMNQVCSRCQGKLEKYKRTRRPVCQECQKRRNHERNKERGLRNKTHFEAKQVA